MKRAHSGFSLMEMAVVLVVAGIMGLGAWKLMISASPVADGDSPKRALLEAQQALEGYAQGHSRLPCPASAPGGAAEANCAGRGFGWLPEATLGISQIKPLRYIVTPALTTASHLYQPLLPPTGNSLVINGLDLCRALSGGMSANAGGVPVAFAVMHPGANSVFEGSNTGVAASADLPGQAQTLNDDDQVLASGAGEVFTRMGCATRLGEVNGAARSAYAAYDLDRMAQMYLRYRNFALIVRQTNTRMAIGMEALAALDLANAIATSVTAVAVTLESAGSAAGDIAAAAIAITVATAALAAQTASLILAQDAETKAGDQVTAAVNFQTLTAQRASETLAAAQAKDARGLLP